MSNLFAAEEAEQSQAALDAQAAKVDGIAAGFLHETLLDLGWAIETGPHKHMLAAYQAARCCCRYDDADIDCAYSKWLEAVVAAGAHLHACALWGWWAAPNQEMDEIWANDRPLEWAHIEQPWELTRAELQAAGRLVLLCDDEVRPVARVFAGWPAELAAERAEAEHGPQVADGVKDAPPPPKPRKKPSPAMETGSLFD